MCIRRKIKLLTSAIVCTFASLSAFECEGIQQQQKTLTPLHSKITETILHSQDIPGWGYEEFSILRTQLIDTWNILIQQGSLEMTGTDKDVRPCFVALQAIVEHVLASELQKEITVLKGTIHTPMPATPLCTTGNISKELVDPSIEIDPARLFTVKTRTTIVRDYLFKGGNLYVVYPKTGLKKRTEEQQTIYQQELKNYPTHLFDVPLNCEAIPDDIIGATYFFQDRSGKTCVFAIKMTQAKDPKEVGSFGLWFGPIDHYAVHKRVRSVLSYMEENGFNALSMHTIP